MKMVLRRHRIDSRLGAPERDSASLQRLLWSGHSFRKRGAQHRISAVSEGVREGQ